MTKEAVIIKAMKNHNYNRGQAMVEMAVFGTLILIVFSVLVAYLQRMNDQQYEQMSTFRRALQAAHTSKTKPGAVVQMTNLQHRRHADVFGGLGKGSRQAFRTFSSIFWSVPKEKEDKDEQSVILRVNQDEAKMEGVQVGNVEYNDDETYFKERLGKEENPEKIITTRTSELRDTITTTFNNEYGQPIWQVIQGVHRDPSDGQYKYSRDYVGASVRRGETWETAFDKNKKDSERKNGDSDASVR